MEKRPIPPLHHNISRSKRIKRTASLIKANKRRCGCRTRGWVWGGDLSGSGHTPQSYAQRCLPAGSHLGVWDVPSGGGTKSLIIYNKTQLYIRSVSVS